MAESKKRDLSPAQVSVMKHKVTEPPYFGKFWDHFERGVYRCAACGTPLFDSKDKFDAKVGWPTFRKPIDERSVQFKSEPGPDDKVEIRCKKCKSHLGYVIPNDPPYYRINSVCLTFEALEIPEIELPEKEEDTEGEARSDRTKADAAAAATAIAPVGWSTGVLAAGAIAGVLIGASGALLYCMKIAAPVAGIQPTTTPVVATSTPEATDSEPAIDNAPQSGIRPRTAPPPSAPAAAGTADTTGLPGDIATTTQ